MTADASNEGRTARAGFSLIELMIVVTLIGLLSSMAIPTYMRFQLKTKSSEAKTNLAAIRTAEESYFSEFGRYVPAVASPENTPGTVKTRFTTGPAGFGTLGWRPEGQVYFSYGVSTIPDGTGYSADAGADIDGDSVLQYWAFIREGRFGVRSPATVGCNVIPVKAGEVAPCTPQSGQSVF